MEKWRHKVTSNKVFQNGRGAYRIFVSIWGDLRSLAATSNDLFEKLPL